MQLPLALWLQASKADKPSNCFPALRDSTRCCQLKACGKRNEPIQSSAVDTSSSWNANATWLQKWNFKMKFQYDSPPSNSIFKKEGRDRFKKFQPATSAITERDCIQQFFRSFQFCAPGWTVGESFWMRWARQGHSRTAYCCPATICDFLSFATHNRVHDYKPSEAYMVRGFSSEGTCRSRRSSSAKSEDDSWNKTK